jgi:acetylornithine/succinyldiaminopimelate/putrescine aminotransferase
LLAEVRAKGDYLQKALLKLMAGFPVIRQVRGLGLMWGLELAQDGAPLVAACRERGVLVNCTQGNVVRLLPPLIVSTEELNRGLQVLEEALALL